MKTYIKDLIWYFQHTRSLKGWKQFKQDIENDKKRGVIG